ncbi:unnamed protein product [Paramecium sonneborni]|uniref:Uncharacterized protein n=1 Tax=Paramecium sonneborni TaxID=65129 RepID=A0A8S1NAK8_9CILI|nr:unnamed protein product [Paramecium sonneborni]
MQLIAAYAYFFEEDSFGEKQTRLWERFQNLSLRESQYRALTNLSVYAR